MSTDEPNVAYPKLYGAPAYARPTAPVDVTPRPVHTDDLPLEAQQTEEEREIASTLPAREYAAVRTEGHGHRGGANGSTADGLDGRGGLLGRPFRLRALAGRLLGGDR